MNYLKRKWTNRFFALFCGLACFLSIAVLGALLGHIVYQGAWAIHWDFFTKLPAPVGEPGGGMAHAMVGTLLILLTASAIGVPLGIAGGLYLAEYRSDGLAKWVRFSSDVLNGLPSIVMGLFAYALLVIPMKSFSGLAGSVALSLTMIPVIVRTTEEVVRLVPDSLREAGLALGLSRWKVTLKIVVSTARAGIATAIVLALARIAGETAPLLFTAFGNPYWQTNIRKPMAALTLQIYTYAISPFEDWRAQAWAGALVLIMMSLMINIFARLVVFKRKA